MTTKFDPAFFEISLDPALLDQMAAVDADDAPIDPVVAERRARLKAEAIEQMAVIIETRLTERQREVLHLYFYQNMTEAQIAAELGIAQQVVSKHLFGTWRRGRKIGGAIGRLKKIMTKLGLDPQKWV